MSDQDQPTTGSQESDYLDGPAGATPGASRRTSRWGLVGVATVAVVATAGAGAWGLAQLLSADGSPADAVPAAAVAYASLDLDPSAGQKIEAIRMLQKFPAIRDDLDLGSRDDVRRWVFGEVIDGDACPDLTYADDVEPWIGDRVAVAAVPDDDAPLAPLVVLQVTDEEAAETGLRALETCGSDEATAGLAFVGGYALLMEEQDDADAFAAAADAAPLSENADFVTWTERIGEPGILNAYVAADAPRLMMDAARAAGDDMHDMGDMGGMGSEEELLGATRDLYRDFEGAAGVLRFADGTVEAELVTRGLPAGVAPVGDPAAPSLAELPVTTAAAVTVSLPDGWLQWWTGSLGGLFGAGAPGSASGSASGSAGEDLWAELEGQTGLQLPEDLETLLGDGLRVSVDGTIDPAALDGADVPQVPIGVRIHGDEAEIVRVLDALRAQLPEGAGDVLVQRSGAGYVALGLDPAYVEQLTTDGGLGGADAFTQVVPEADRVSGGLYVNFDAEDWTTRLAEQLAGGEPDVRANVAPLDALGLSSWLDDEGVAHGLFRLSTD